MKWYRQCLQVQEQEVTMPRGGDHVRVVSLLIVSALSVQLTSQGPPTLRQSIVGGSDERTRELSTEELESVLAAGRAVVIDARPHGEVRARSHSRRGERGREGRHRRLDVRVGCDRSGTSGARRQGDPARRLLQRPPLRQEQEVGGRATRCRPRRCSSLPTRDSCVASDRGRVSGRTRGHPTRHDQ